MPGKRGKLGADTGKKVASTWRVKESIWDEAENKCVGEAQMLELSYKALDCRNSHVTFTKLSCLHTTLAAW